MDVFAHSFNLMDTKQLFYSIWWSAGSHVDVTFDDRGRVAFDAIKGKEPPLTATATSAFEDTQNAIEVNVQASVIRIFLESAFLGEFKVKKNKSERKISQNFFSTVVSYLECWKRAQGGLPQFFQDLARATIACHTSVSVTRTQMTQVTSRSKKNNFSTWKASNLFGICSDSFKLRSNMYSSLGPKKYGKKVW